jgi:hypothetical protein
MEAHGVTYGFLIDDRDVVCRGFAGPMRHVVKCRRHLRRRDDPYYDAMALSDRDSYGGSILERGLLGIGDRLGLLSGVVLAVSAFTGWYSGAGEGVQVSVTGWDTGIGGKAVFFLGIAVVLVVTLREAGVEPPHAVPQSLVTIFLGSAATIIVLVKAISIPDDYFFAGRGVGIWISLAAAIGVIVAGLLQASEEL